MFTKIVFRVLHNFNILLIIHVFQKSVDLDDPYHSMMILYFESSHKYSPLLYPDDIIFSKFSCPYKTSSYGCLSPYP